MPRWAQGEIEVAKRPGQKEMECTRKVTWLQLALMSPRVRLERSGQCVGETHVSLQERWGEPVLRGGLPGTQGNRGAGAHGGALGSRVLARTERPVWEALSGFYWHNPYRFFPIEPREPGSDNDIGIFWGKPIFTQVKLGFLSWDG